MGNDFKSKAEELMPREKMKAAPSLSDVASRDLLAIILKTGVEGCDVLELSDRLITLCGGTSEFVRIASDWRAMRFEIDSYNAKLASEFVDICKVELSSQAYGLSEEVQAQCMKDIMPHFTKRPSKRSKANQYKSDADATYTIRSDFSAKLPNSLFSLLPQALYDKLSLTLHKISLKAIKGVGETKLLELAAAIELSRRRYEPSSKDSDLHVGDSSEGASLTSRPIKQLDDAAFYFRRAFQGIEGQENFFVLPVNSALVPLSEPILISRGTSTTTPVMPTDVFRLAINWGAYGIFVAHNHPSGTMVVSGEDMTLTTRLVEISRLLSVPLFDHIIVGTASEKYTFLSMREKGYLSADKLR